MTFFESGGTGSAWQPPADPFSRLHRDRRRRRVVAGSLVAAIVAAVLSVVVVIVGPSTIARSANELFFGAPPPPSAELIAVADRSFLTEEGRRLLYATRPQLVGREGIVAECPVSSDGEVTTLGCYSALSGIVIYQPDDPRIADSMVTILAHELLHAAYDELGDGEVFRIDDLLVAELERIPADDVVRQLIDSSTGDHEASRETEIFAYLGSQVALEGGFAPELEALYARYFTDRLALVQVYGAVETVVEAVATEAYTAEAELANEEGTNVANRGRWDADRAAHEAARAEYNSNADEYNALPEQQRATATAQWTDPDGTVRSTPYGQYLDDRLAELEAYRVQLDERSVALAAAEAAAAARRPQVEAQLADLRALLESAYPGQSFE